MAADPSPERFRDLMLDEPGLPEVMACVFGIQEHEVRTYRTLLDNHASTVAELAEELDHDRSDVNPSVSTTAGRL